MDRWLWAKSCRPPPAATATPPAQHAAGPMPPPSSGCWQCALVAMVFCLPAWHVCLLAVLGSGAVGR